MDIRLTEENNKGKAHLGDMAEMTYSRAGSKLLIIDHTWVSEELRGQGTGRRLLNEIVEYARSKGLEILPLCPYAKSVFKKEAGIRDVLRS